MAKEYIKISIVPTVIKVEIRKDNPPTLLAKNEPCYIAKELDVHEGYYNIKQTHEAPSHPQTQGKIELEQAIGEWVEYSNNFRYHESLYNLPLCI